MVRGDTNQGGEFLILLFFKRSYSSRPRNSSIADLVQKGLFMPSEVKGAGAFYQLK